MYSPILTPRRSRFLKNGNSSQFCSGSVQVTPLVLHQCDSGAVARPCRAATFGAADAVNEVAPVTAMALAATRTANHFFGRVLTCLLLSSGVWRDAPPPQTDPAGRSTPGRHDILLLREP